MNWKQRLSNYPLLFMSSSIILFGFLSGCGASQQTAIFDKEFAPYDGAGLRGLKRGSAVSAVEEGKLLAKDGDYEEALVLFKKAQERFPDEDNLLLMAASLDKINARCKGKECQGRCSDALMGWQRYLGNCKRCLKTKQRRKYRSYGLKKQSQLGAQCGGQIQLKSTPSKAWITIDKVKVGNTPQTLWLPVGERRYSLQKKSSKTQGTILIEKGTKRELSLTLSNDTYQRVAKVQLKCKDQKCSQRLKLDDPYWLKITVERDSFIYVFAESMGKVSKVFPTAGSNRASKGNTLRLPSINTYSRATSNNAERLHIFFADQPIKSFSVKGDELMSVFTRQRQLATVNPSRGDQSVVEVKGTLSLLTIQLSDGDPVAQLFNDQQQLH